eukprot:jgi/Mesvir1/11588/Mv00004-RA.1
MCQRGLFGCFFVSTILILNASAFRPSLIESIGQSAGFFGKGLSVAVRDAQKHVSLNLPPKSAWRNFGSIEDAIPKFIGTLKPDVEGNDTANWAGTCFNHSSATVHVSDTGITIDLDLRDALSYTCMDLYVFCTPKRFVVDYFMVRGKHQEKMDGWLDNERDMVMAHGVDLFLLSGGFVGTLHALADVLPLFVDSPFSESYNVDFLKTRMGAKFVPRLAPYLVDLPQSVFQSGDFLVLSKLKGVWGGFETMEKWVSGSYAGHAAMLLWGEPGTPGEGVLYVAESGVTDEEGQEVIAIREYNDWLLFQSNDPADVSVCWLPLSAESRSRFDLSAAWAMVRQLVGRPYGFHNIIFSWIDTPNDNYPSPISAEVVVAVMSIWEQVQPAYSTRLWSEGLNKRMNTTGLDIGSLVQECEQRGISLKDVIAIPERDEWVYSDGVSVTCNSFVVEVWKAAGVLGNLTHAIQATEFTVKDTYMLKIFEDDISLLPPECDRDGLPYCQLLGKYVMELPGFNTIAPYPAMNERCPSLPPDYKRPRHC